LGDRGANPDELAVGGGKGHALDARLVGFANDPHVLDQARQLLEQKGLGSIAQGLFGPRMEIDQHAFAPAITP